MEDTKPVTFPRALALAVVFGVLTAAAPDAMAKPLEEELSSILIDHPNIRAGYKTIESSRQDIAKARAGYFPTVAATGSGGPEYIDSPGERARRANAKAWLRSKVLAGVTVTQNMFSGYATATAVKTARLNREIAEITLEGTRQSTMFEGVTAYIDVLRQKRLIELARANELTIERQLNLEDERVQRGSGIAVDVLQAKSRLQLAKERLITFEGALEDAVSRYFQVFGHPPEIENMTDPVPPVNIIPSGLERALEVALTENPAVGNSNTAVEMARESRTMVRSEYFPVVDLVGSWNYELNNNTVTGTTAGRVDRSFNKLDTVQRLHHPRRLDPGHLQLPRQQGQFRLHQPQGGGTDQTCLAGLAQPPASVWGCWKTRSTSRPKSSFPANGYATRARKRSSTCSTPKAKSTTPRSITPRRPMTSGWPSISSCWPWGGSTPSISACRRFDASTRGRFAGFYFSTTPIGRIVPVSTRALTSWSARSPVTPAKLAPLRSAPWKLAPVTSALAKETPVSTA